MSHDHADPANAGTLHHLELSTANLAESLPFWDWLLTELGYEEKNDWAEGRSWIHGPTYIVLVQADATEPSFDREAPGLDHLAFHADSRSTVDELTATIRDRDDATVLFKEQHPYAGGYYALYCEGPDGVKIEVVGPDT